MISIKNLQLRAQWKQVLQTTRILSVAVSVPLPVMELMIFAWAGESFRKGSRMNPLGKRLKARMEVFAYLMVAHVSDACQYARHSCPHDE